MTVMALFLSHEIVSVVFFVKNDRDVGERGGIVSGKPFVRKYQHRSHLLPFRCI